MSFTPIVPGDWGNAFARRYSARPECPDNGTVYIQAGLGSTLRFRFGDNSLFNVVSLDLTGYSTVVPQATVHFVGYRSTGEVVTRDIAVNGIVFQTVTLGPEFSGLTRVEIPTYGWSLDNLVLSVPEPTLAALAPLALLLFRLRPRLTSR